MDLLDEELISPIETYTGHNHDMELPVLTSSGRSPSDEQWEIFKPRLRVFYSDTNFPFARIQEYMSSMYDFRVKVDVHLRKAKDWGIRRNIPMSTTIAMLRDLKDELTRSQNLPMDYKFNDEPVNWKRLCRAFRKDTVPKEFQNDLLLKREISRLNTECVKLPTAIAPSFNIDTVVLDDVRHFANEFYHPFTSLEIDGQAEQSVSAKALELENAASTAVDFFRSGGDDHGIAMLRQALNIFEDPLCQRSPDILLALLVITQTLRQLEAERPELHLSERFVLACARGWSPLTVILRMSQKPDKWDVVVREVVIFSMENYFGLLADLNGAGHKGIELLSTLTRLSIEKTTALIWLKQMSDKFVERLAEGSKPPAWVYHDAAKIHIRDNQLMLQYNEPELRYAEALLLSADSVLKSADLGLAGEIMRLNVHDALGEIAVIENDTASIAHHQGRCLEMAREFLPTFVYCHAQPDTASHQLLYCDKCVPHPRTKLYLKKLIVSLRGLQKGVEADRLRAEYSETIEYMSSSEYWLK